MARENSGGASPDNRVRNLAETLFTQSVMIRGASTNREVLAADAIADAKTFFRVWDNDVRAGSVPQLTGNVN